MTDHPARRPLCGAPQAAGHASVTRRPPAPDRNRSITRTSPSNANGAVPDAVSRPTDAPNARPEGGQCIGVRIGRASGQLVLPLGIVGQD